MKKSHWILKEILSGIYATLKSLFLDLKGNIKCRSQTRKLGSSRRKWTVKKLCLHNILQADLDFGPVMNECTLGSQSNALNLMKEASIKTK